MVYINSDGSIGNKPWHKNIAGIFWGILTFIVVFFQTLINPGWSNGKHPISNYGSNGSGSGGGGGGGGGRGKPAWGQRPFGAQCRTLSSLQSPMSQSG